MFVFGRFATRVLQLQTRKHDEVVVDVFGFVGGGRCEPRSVRWGFEFCLVLPEKQFGTVFFGGFLWVPTFGWSGLRWVVWLLIR